ncbi:MAG TPA: hypothetical protein VF755_14845 [Catenuloplanes sp.]|jgi:hypothetical protein
MPTTAVPAAPPPAASGARFVARPVVVIAAVAVMLGLGLAGGLATGKLLDDPHTASAEVLVGTVTWSNPQARRIAFVADAAARDPLPGDTFYEVIADGWTDAGGTIQLTGTYPTCLADDRGESPSTDGHRVELEVIHRDTRTRQAQHIVTHVRCLD